MVKKGILILSMMQSNTCALLDLADCFPITISSKRATIFNPPCKAKTACFVYHGNVRIKIGSNLKIMARKARVIAQKIDQNWECSRIMLAGNVHIMYKNSDSTRCISYASRALLDLKSFSFTLMGTIKKPATSTVRFSC